MTMYISIRRIKCLPAILRFVRYVLSFPGAEMFVLVYCALILSQYSVIAQKFTEYVPLMCKQ